MPDPTEVLERELAVLLRRGRALSGQLARQVHPELDAAAYGLVAWLDETGPARATELAAYFGLTKPTVSRQLTLLENLALVARAPDPDDGRAQVIVLTAEGRDRLRAVRLARRDRFRDLMAGWPERDVARLGELLGRFNATFGQGNPTAGSAGADRA